MGERAETLLARHPNISISSSVSENAKEWANESHSLAPSAYHGAVQNEKLPDDYLETNVAKLEVLLIKGGLRLAHLIVDIFSPPTANDGPLLLPTVNESTSQSAFIYGVSESKAMFLE